MRQERSDESMALRKYQELTLYTLWPKGMSACQDAWVAGYIKSLKAAKERRNKDQVSTSIKHRRIHADVMSDVNHSEKKS